MSGSTPTVSKRWPGHRTKAHEIAKGIAERQILVVMPPFEKTVKADRTIEPTAPAFEAEPDGFSLAVAVGARHRGARHPFDQRCGCRVSIAVRRPTGWTRRCSCACSWACCAARAGIAVATHVRGRKCQTSKP